jgi:hypothetical protein
MKFSFSINHILQFRGCLACERCQGKTKGGNQCSRKTCIGSGWCYIHLLNEKQLKIQTSAIPNAGKGLFAMDKTKAANAIVFKVGAKIIEYDGELVDSDTLEDRYGDETAPYGIHINRDRFEDGALHRGVGTLVNQSPRAAMTNARFGVSRNRIVLFATKNIRNGQEVYVRYGGEYRFGENTQYATK